MPEGGASARDEEDELVPKITASCEISQKKHPNSFPNHSSVFNNGQDYYLKKIKLHCGPKRQCRAILFPYRHFIFYIVTHKPFTLYIYIYILKHYISYSLLYTAEAITLWINK